MNLVRQCSRVELFYFRLRYYCWSTSSVSTQWKNKNGIFLPLTSTGVTPLHPSVVWAKYASTNVEEKEESSSDERDDYGSDEIVSLLQRIFELDDRKKAEKIVYKSQQLLEADPDLVMERCDFLVEKGVTKNRLLRMPWLLTFDIGKLQKKEKLVMEKLRIPEFRCAVPFFDISSKTILRIASVWGREIAHLSDQDIPIPGTTGKHYNNRTEIISVWLSCEPYEIADMMKKTPLLKTGSLVLIKAKIMTMLDSGVAAQDIVKDPFIFTNMLSTIQTRLALCKKNGLTEIKPWMLRCTPKAFNGYTHRRHEEQHLLDGHTDIASFLSESLQCSPRNAKEILIRVPSIRGASATKLNEMIQFLCMQGFTSAHILEVPRILGHSVETVEKRINELASYGFTPHSLFILCYTSKNYRYFIQKLRNQNSADSN